jgi:hypothetical protein
MIYPYSLYETVLMALDAVYIVVLAVTFAGLWFGSRVHRIEHQTKWL